MDRSLILAAGLSAALAAHAGGTEELSIHAKSLASAAALSLTAAPPLARPADAPFVAARPRDLVPEMLLHEEMERRAPGAGCEASATDLCYDLKEARLVYKPARAYMPAISGMRAESISLRHDRIVLKYSFR